VRRVVVLVVVGVFVAAAYAAMTSEFQYGTYAFWHAPEHIKYCDHRYDATDDETAGDPAWKTIGRTLTRRRIAVDPRTDQECPTDLYVRVGEDRYRTYVDVDR